ncbi:LpxI family protein [Rubellimicrobium rubrum]|uniref:LpxI family protein n=1 Tax=Rubellimicrobium rubrum TaxID=2585369 RepID=A0A5C4MY53_9RHOB|nr:UDP-2,3-diacylglucosamine diphosphatase LpxI [Rubellimicrobium rubrum]TNC51129.1 LpxI family protein [Rubellimicrobium rubrum]
MIALIGSVDPLTSHVAAALGRTGVPPVLCVVGQETSLVAVPPEPLVFRIEHLGTLMRHLSDLEVSTVCFSGKIARPQIDPRAVDPLTAPLVPRLMDALQKGDDGALRTVMHLFEDAGFVVRSVQDIVPDLLPPAGVLTVAQPSPGQEADSARAEEVHRILAEADIGQGLIVRNNQVLAVETAPGTDFMLRSVIGLARGAVFFKAPKRNQDRRADLPVIGPGTVEQAQGSGLAAIVIEARGVMVLERDRSVAAADRAGIVLWVREPRS